ncbi:MAG: DUF58 domain-containing protein [Candidatus Marinimicrobia bacterium]|nr:DUF58 domain-containing protein [Candidatus Neomarinimicrobiota bacterium]|tara:strand:+ start:10836 stop:11732 length:897 start_codon:yes stop_codon:yes gene_type:complete
MSIDKRKYLQPEIVARLDNMALRARLVVEGYLVGIHKSPYHGFSVEFAEHRAYGLGDELKHLDWKLYGKTDRYYIKQYEEETNLRSYLILDVSKSMTYGSHEVSKLDYGSYLTAALTYLMLNQRDAVSLTTFDEKRRDHVPPRSTQSHLNSILGQLEHLSPGSDTQIAPTLHKLAEIIKKRGLVILISDLLDEPDQVLSGLKHFRHRNHEVIVFHLIDPRERDLDFSLRTRFRDIETGVNITTEPWQIRKAYRGLVKKFQMTYMREMRRRNIDYVPLMTDQALDLALTRYLTKRRAIA